MRIYQALLDQHLIAGIGNIYANEALWQVGIRPTRRTKSINQKELVQLFQSVHVILKKAISKGGTSTDKYLDALGNIGTYVNYLKVYKQEGNTCKKKGCKGVIKRIKIGGRSAFYCPVHQK